MNILLVTPYFAPQTGGVATFVDSLQRLLRQRGHQAFVLLPGPSHVITHCETTTDALAFSYYMRLPCVPEAPLKGFLAFLIYCIPTLLRLNRFIKENAIDLVSLEYPLPYMYYFYILKRLCGLKLIVGIHGDDILSLHLTPNYEQWLVKQLIRRADWLLAHSASLISQVETLIGQRNGHRSHIPCGIDSNQLRSMSEDAGQTFAWSARPYILTVAKLYERKGLDVLLHAISKLGPIMDCYRFVIVGDGPEEHGLQQLALQLEIQEAVVFTGEMQPSDISKLHQHCEFFVLPSRSEPFGIVLLEAMVFGKAIVATKVGGIPELVIDGHNGILVPPNNSDALARALTRMISDRKLRSHLGKNGLALVEEVYNFHIILDRYTALFQRVLDEGSPRS
jgi:glycosyltransferase involved in cell wall biosynthesis